MYFCTNMSQNCLIGTVLYDQVPELDSFNPLSHSSGLLDVLLAQVGWMYFCTNMSQKCHCTVLYDQVPELDSFNPLSHSSGLLDVLLAQAR